MTREKTIRLAKEAEIECDLIDEEEGEVFYITTETLERFAALVEQAMIADGWRQCAQGQKSTQHCALLESAVAAEREAIIAMMPGGHSVDPQWVCDAIRARNAD